MKRNTTYYLRSNFYIITIFLLASVTLPNKVCSQTSDALIGTNFWNKNWSSPDNYFKSGVDWATVTDPWSPQFIADLQLAKYKVIRFMDWVPTNSSTKKDWSDRVLKTANHHTNNDGVAYEWQIDLCNRLNADIWITVPHLTIESYESDPANNYWTNLADMILEQLNSGLNVWLEYSNESWSQGASFNQGDYTGTRGVAMGFDAQAYTARFAFHVYAATRLHKVFLDKFAGQSDRIKTVIAGQAGSEWGDDKNWGTHVQALALQNKLPDGSTNTNLNPFDLVPEYYTIANYVSANNGSASDLREQWTTSIATAKLAAQRVLNTLAFDNYPALKLVAYEGGSHITTNADVFSRNAQSYYMYKEWLDGMADDFELTCHYTHLGEWSSGGAWGAKETTSQPLSQVHKFRAIVDWINGVVTSAGEDLTHEDVSVYPIPAKGNILITEIYSDKNIDAKITLLTPTSQYSVDLKRTLVKGNNTISIPIDHVKNGLHILVINKGSERIVRKVIITR